LTISDVISLFGWQFLTGLLLSGFVPLLGNYLRLRNEWLAALGLTHIAAAGGVVGVLFSWPVLVTTLIFGLSGASVKALLNKPGNTVYAVMILTGWTLLLLISANHHHAHTLGQVLIDGQLYFTGLSHLIAAAVLTLTGGLLLYWLSPRVMREVIFPGQQSGNTEPVRVYNLAFDALVAITVAIAAITIGIMATFALVLLPAWTAYGLAKNWRNAIWLSALIGIVGYAIAFLVAIRLDQPFGPCLVTVLLVMSLLRLLGCPSESSRKQETRSG